MRETNKLVFKGTNVLGRNLNAVNDGYELLLNQGGSRSSKTWSIWMMLLYRAMLGEREVVTIARANMTTITSTVLMDFKEILEIYKIPHSPSVNPNRKNQIYNVYGTEFGFFGLDNPEKVHGRKQDIAWINEIIEIKDRNHFDQLEQRTAKLMVVDFNPWDDSHFVFDLEKRKDAILIRSSMLDNEHNLPSRIVRKIRGYEPTKENYEAGTADPYMWDVYGLGKKAKLKGLIFTKWKMVDEIPEDAKSLGAGLDFGYTNDPSALVDLYMHDNELWLDERIYDTGLENISPYDDVDTLDKRFRMLEIGNTPITADSSEPKSISELSRAGWNIKGAIKGQGSVEYGISLLKGYRMNITKRSTNLESEARKYKWTEDKDGKRINKPIDDFNHGWDAVRYRATAVLGSRHKGRTAKNNVWG